MNKTLTYKGYTASLEFCPETEKFFGRVQDTRHFILFEGKTAEEAKANFADLINSFPQVCGEVALAPEVPQTEVLATI
jgi:predicted HicB family RNase H-like nuclease